MERAKPTMEQILVVRNPQSWLLEGSFGAAHPWARRAGEDRACWWQGHAEEVAGAQPEQSPDSAHPAPRLLPLGPAANSLTKPSHGETSVGKPLVPTPVGWQH